MKETKINSDLKKYIEKEIFPLYAQNDEGHNLKHIKYVIKRCLKFASQFPNINLDMLYTVAAFHDLAHHINKDKHEVLSAQIFYENEKMTEFFSPEERILMKEAIIDHRASLEYVPRNEYGKILSSADRSTDISELLRRTHAYSCTHYPHMTTIEMIDRAYNHMIKKYGIEGYAPIYCKDPTYEKFKKEVNHYKEDKKEFIKKYREVNKIT